MRWHPLSKEEKRKERKKKKRMASADFGTTEKKWGDGVYQPGFQRVY